VVRSCCLLLVVVIFLFRLRRYQDPTAFELRRMTSMV
jgi:hypothetical protein